MLNAPSIYVEGGYAEARTVDPKLADSYIKHTTIGDPELDPVFEELADLPHRSMNRFVAAGINDQAKILSEAPQALREFFEGINDVPAWVDFESFDPGVRAFFVNASSIFAGFVAGTLIEGFATTIAKSFFMTGRVIDRGVRRLQQNNRHQVEVFYPEGLRRENDGWKLSVRIRFVHAKIRYLLANSETWDKDIWGTPINAANLGLSIAIFSARTLAHSTALGARYSPEQRESYCAIWRYTGYLMGIPESILYTTNEQAQHLFRIGTLCEPDPTDESVIMANTLINSAPLVAGISNPTERKALVSQTIFPISRKLVGDDLADQLRFPASKKLSAHAALFLFWLDVRLKAKFPRLFKTEISTIEKIFGASLYSDLEGIAYRLPDNLDSELSSPW